MTSPPSMQIPSVDIISPPKTTTQLTTPQLSKQRQLYHFQNPTKDMSLLRTIATRAPRAPLAATKRVRFSTSPYAQKDSSSAVKDTIESVNKTVGNAAVKGIEKSRESHHHFYIPNFAITTLYNYPKKALRSFSSSSSLLPKQQKLTPHPPFLTEQATENLKSTVGLNAKQAEGSAKETTGEAQGKASELAGDAKSKTQEVAGQAKGKAAEVQGKTQEVAGQAKGKTQEVAGQAKGKAEEVKGKM